MKEGDKTSVWVLFPNQLFEPRIMTDVWDPKNHIAEVWLVEDPCFFGDRTGDAYGPSTLRLNPLRIQYDLRTCESYASMLQQDKRLRQIHVRHIKQGEPLPILRQGMRVYMYDPVDHLVVSRWQKQCSPAIPLTIVDTPMFLLTKDEVLAYGKAKKRLRHAAFYAYLKKTHLKDLQLPEKSMDAYNRERWRKDRDPPIPATIRGNKRPIRLESRKAAQKEDAKEQRRYELLEYLPTDHAGVRVWLRAFLTERMKYFGKYQDAIVDGESWMFHSGLSIFLNRGLLTPKRLLQEVFAWFKKHSASAADSADITASYEGFVRQIIWREYCRVYYECMNPKDVRKNVFGFPKKKLGKPWYDGTTGIRVLDQAILEAWQTGYLHHIRRLMVVANYMTLSEVHPDAMYKWFMEFALDSYPWVMVFNVYGMGSYSDGGRGSYKPYVSSSGYLKKMGADMTREEADRWDKKYRAFLGKHANVLQHSPIWRGSQKMKQ